MKKFIFIFLTLLLFSFSNSSLGQAVMRSAESEYETLENNFEIEVEMLSVTQVGLFQKKSEQQIQDWVNLIDLISSDDWKPSLKKKLNEQAIRFFTNPTDTLFFLEGNNLKDITVEKYLKTLNTVSKTSTKLNIIKISPPTLEEHNYNWMIIFQTKKQDNSVKKFKAKFILKQENKTFGTKEKKVWDVLIQEIKEISK